MSRIVNPLSAVFQCDLSSTQIEAWRIKRGAVVSARSFNYERRIRILLTVECLYGYQVTITAGSQAHRKAVRRLNKLRQLRTTLPETAAGL